MTPRIEIVTEKKLVGMRTVMTFASHNPIALWRNFMPRRNEISNRLGMELYSLEVYPPGFFAAFSPNREFEKWAAVAVTEPENIPAQMACLIVPPGEYAVFGHRGPAGSAAATYEYIFRSWLPASEFVVDDRPHFALMGTDYRHDDPDAEEEIWIPVRRAERS